MNLEFEEHVPVQFSPIMSPASQDDEEDTLDELDYERTFETNFSSEYVEPSLPEHVLSHQKIHQQEYVEPYFSETKNSCYQTFSLNGVQLSQQDDSGNDSDNSYAALDEQSLDDMKTEEEEGSPTPPRKKLKIKDVPIMYSEVMASNFLYHTTKYINLPVCLPKISNLPFHSLPNVKLSVDRHFMTSFSQMAPPSDFDTNCHLAKLRTRIPSILFSSHLKPTSVLHNNYLCKPNSLSLIMNQELKLPDVLCPGCETKSANCLDCKYLKNETSPVDQANLSILRNSIKLLKDPVDSTKQIIEID